MAQVSIPYVQALRAKGRTYHYYRRGGLRIALPGAPGSPEWQQAYNQAEAAFQASQRSPQTGPGGVSHPPGSIGALIQSYRASTAWQALAPASRADYEKGLSWLLANMAAAAAERLSRPHIIKVRERAAWEIGADGTRALLPSRANKVLAILSILMEHACDLGWRNDNPVRGVTKVPTQGDGYRPWKPEEVARFLAAADPFWRLALTLALCTGQRGQDLVGMAWSAYDGSAVEVVQEKTGAKVWIPVHPELRAALDQATRQGLFILMRPDRRPVKKGRAARPMTPWPVNAFQKAAGAAIAAAGLTGIVWHGLRPTAASWMAEGGCSDAEIMAITGHKTTRMAQHYRRGAQQKELARAAVSKLQLRHKTP